MTYFSKIDTSLTKCYPFSAKQCKRFTDKLICKTLKKGEHWIWQRPWY